MTAELRDAIVSEIMSLVRQRPRRIEPKPTIAELEKILNSETTDEVNIEADGSVTVRPTITTVGAVSDKVCAVVEAEIASLRSALAKCREETVAECAKRICYRCRHGEALSSDRQWHTVTVGAVTEISAICEAAAIRALTSTGEGR